MSAGNNVPQTISAESEMDTNIFLQKRLKEAKNTLDLQACVYYSRHTEDEISQQSADQLSRSFKPVEFDGFRMQAELWNPEPEKENRS